jgi:lysophospholipase L1-like esterase
MRQRGIARWKLALLGLLPTVLLFGLVEGGLRVYVHRKAAQDRGRALPTPDERHAYQRTDPLLGYALKPGYDAGGIRINALGFRGPEITAHTPAGTVRIVATGDSTTFGLAGEACPYPAQLQALLGARGDERRFEVINAGVEGYKSAHLVRLLDAHVGALGPDVVIFFIGWNDLYGTDPFAAPDLHEDLQAGGAVAGRWTIADHIYLVRFVRRIAYVDLPRLRGRFAGRVAPAAGEVHPGVTRRYAIRLTQLVRRTRELRATPVLVTLPSLLSPHMSDAALRLLLYPSWARADYRLILKMLDRFNETIRDVGRDEHAPLIDAAVAIDQLGIRKEALFFDVCHMYCEGNGLLARFVAQELIRQRVIP